VRKLTFDQLMQMNDDEVASYWAGGQLPPHVSDGDTLAGIYIHAVDEYNESNTPLRISERS